MRKIAIAASLIVLAACSKSEAPAPAPSSEAASEAAMAAPTPTAGSYDVTAPDGSKGTTVLNADGTYTDTDSKGKVVKGKWAMKDGKTCFTPEGQADECYTESQRAADGSFTATDAKGQTVKVTPQTKM